LDLGTGTGIIAIALCKLGFSDIDATDINPDALLTAHYNATLNNCESHINVFRSDLFDGLTKKYALIISNPPTFPILSTEQSNSKLNLAFFSGKYGPEFIFSVIDKAPSVLMPEGRLLLLLPSFLDLPQITDRLHHNDFSTSVIESKEIPVRSYIEDISSLGLNGPAMINSVIEKMNTSYSSDAFKFDQEGKAEAFWLKIIEAKRLL
jgi:HemK-related putative methylase